MDAVWSKQLPNIATLSWLTFSLSWSQLQLGQRDAASLQLLIYWMALLPAKLQTQQLAR
jgi:hypothetical protein